MPERHVLERHQGVAAQHASEAADALAGDGLRLCGIAEEPFCPLANGSCASRTSLRCKVPDLGREPVERATEDRQRSQQLGVAIAPDDLRRDILASQLERCQRELLDAGIDVAVGAHGTRQLADRDALERALDTVAAACQVVPPAGSLSPNVVGSAYTRRAYGPCRVVRYVARWRARAPRRAPDRASRAARRRRRAAAARGRCRRRRGNQPMWNQRDSAPTCSATASVNAITS